jgi:predicted Zn-dependent peptidase
MLTNNGTYRVYTLDNGLRVAIDRTPTKTISGTFKVHFGAIYEMPGEEGLAHFLEHSLLDAGTRKYSPSETDQLLEKFGKINAETRIDSTISPVQMLSKHLDPYLDLISEAFFCPTFEESRVERERTAVLNEIADQKSNPSYKNSLIFYEALFGKGHPLTYHIAGKEDVVSQASIEDLKKFHSRGYFANNSDLILCGGVPKNVDELIQQYFANKPMGNVQSFVFPQPKPLTERQVIHLHEPALYNIDKPDQSRAQVIIGLLVPPETFDEHYSVIMLNMILGGHNYSRLMQATRYESGLAYHIKSEYHGEFNTGYIQISTSVPSKKVNETVDAIFSAFQKLQSELVKEDELEKRKQTIEFDIEYGMELNEGRAALIESDLKLGTRLEERINKLNGVTPQEIRDTALKYLPRSKEDKNFVMMISDPLKKE